MTENMKYHVDSLSCLLDLSDEILRSICRYLSPCHVLYSFYTPLRSEFRLHRVISDYYTKLKLSELTNNEYTYLLSLFSRSNFIPPRLESLILSNENITCLTQHFFDHIRTNLIQTMFTNLKSLKLIDCTSEDLEYIYSVLINYLQLESLHIRIRNDNHHERKIEFIPTTYESMNQIIFHKKMSSIKILVFEINNGLALSKSLKSHENLRNLNLILQTIDDLYILLDGLVPNVQIMIIQLCHKRILSGFRPKSTSLCIQLIDFTLLEPRIGFMIDDLKSIFCFMPNLNKLTLSIRDTPDRLFCHGPSFESFLNKFLPHLHQFDYTMTHRIVDQHFIADFIRWPMNIVFYNNENCRWIHIYSLPWPSSKYDQRRLPILRDGSNRSVTSDVKRFQYMEHVLITKSQEFYQLKTKFIRARQLTTNLSIHIQLPLRISKLILSEQTHISSFESIVQPSISHLIVKCQLTDVDQLSKLARQFPDVNYLELIFPLNESLLIHYLQNIFSLTDTIENDYKLWSELIHFTSYLNYLELELDAVWDNKTFYDWLIENTDLKYHKYTFYGHYLLSQISIWL